VDGDDYLSRLEKASWTTAQLVAGAEITYDAFTNYMRSDLLFASKSAGRGKARAFPLIDIYQVALLARLSKLTGKLAWSAGALNYAILIDAEIRWLGPDFLDGRPRKDQCSIHDVHSDRLAEVATSIYAAPPPYHHRDALRPYFIFAQERDLTHGRTIIECGQKGDIGVLDSTDAGGVYINMTATLRAVDRRLIGVSCNE
jgi:hypothetical protein